MNDYTFWDDDSVFGVKPNNEPINYSSDDIWEDKRSQSIPTPEDLKKPSYQFPERDLSRVLITPVGGMTIPDKFSKSDLDKILQRQKIDSPLAGKNADSVFDGIYGPKNSNAVTEQQIQDYIEQQKRDKSFAIQNQIQNSRNNTIDWDSAIDQRINPEKYRNPGNWQGWETYNKLTPKSETRQDLEYAKEYFRREKEESDKWNRLLTNQENIAEFRKQNPTPFSDYQVQQVLEGWEPGDIYGPRDIESERRKARETLDNVSRNRAQQGNGVGYTRSTEYQIPGGTLPGFTAKDPYTPTTPNNTPNNNPASRNNDLWNKAIDLEFRKDLESNFKNDSYRNPNNPGNGPKAAYDAPSSNSSGLKLDRLKGDLLELPKQIKPANRPIYDSDNSFGGGNNSNNSRQRTSQPTFVPGVKGGDENGLPIYRYPSSTKGGTGNPVYIPEAPLNLQGVPRNSNRLNALGAVTEGLAFKAAVDELNRIGEIRNELARKYGITLNELDSIAQNYSPKRNTFNPFDWMAGRQSERYLGIDDGFDMYKDPLGLENMIKAAKRGVSPAAYRKQFGEDNGRGLNKLPLGPFPQRQSEKEEEEKAKQRWAPKGFSSPSPLDIKNFTDNARRFFKPKGDSAVFGDDFRGKSPDEIDEIIKKRWRKHNGIPEGNKEPERDYDPDKDGVINPGNPSPFPDCMEFGLAWKYPNQKDRGFIGWIRQSQAQADLFKVDEVYVGVASNSYWDTYNDDYHDYWNVRHTLFKPPEFINHFGGKAPTWLRGEIMTVEDAYKMILVIKTRLGTKRILLIPNNPAGGQRYFVIRDTREPVNPVQPSNSPNPKDPEGPPMSNCRYLPDFTTTVTLQSYVEATGKFKPTPVVLHKEMGQFALWISAELQKIHRKMGNVDKYLEASKNVESPIPLNAPFAEMMAMQTFMFGQLPNQEYFKSYATKLAPGKTLAMRQAAQTAIGFSFAGHHQYAGMKLKSNMLDPNSKPAKITTAFDFAVHSFSNLGGMIGLPNKMTVNGANQSFKNATDGIETANAKVSALEQDLASVLAIVNAIAKNQEIQNGFLVHSNADIEMLVKDGGFKYKNKIANVPSLFTQSKPADTFSGNLLERILTPLKNQRIVREWDDKADKLQLGRHTNINAQIAASPYKIELGADPKQIQIPFLSNATFKDGKGKDLGTKGEMWRQWVDSTSNPPSALSTGVDAPKIKEFIKGVGLREVPKPNSGGGTGSITTGGASKN